MFLEAGARLRARRQQATGRAASAHPAAPRYGSACGISTNAFQAGGRGGHAAKQDRVFGAETPTDGYRLLKLFASYS